MKTAIQVTKKDRNFRELSEDVASMMKHRQEQRRVLADAKDSVDQVETEIKSYLVREQQWQYVSINWKKLQRDAGTY